MDSYLVEYLQSGEAWILVGSGPSTQAGYPQWSELADIAVRAVRSHLGEAQATRLRPHLNARDYPAVFESAAELIGMPTLLEPLRSALRRRSGATNDIYRVLARWPVPVYLTTNFDDEIHDTVNAVAPAYHEYTNTVDHLSLLSPSTRGAIFKLHGDLRSANGLVLTKSQYLDIATGDSWESWRIKMTSVFQMCRVIVIGHSLTDPHIRHVLESAKKGGGISRPVCWIAPDVTPDECRRYLENFRIRVISYDNRDGLHRNLPGLLKTISDFVPARTSIRMRNDVATATSHALGSSAAATGFYIFNSLMRSDSFDQKRGDVIAAAVLSSVPKLKAFGDFSIEDALYLAGWPTGHPVPSDVAQTATNKLVADKVIVSTGSRFQLGIRADVVSQEARDSFEHAQTQFKTSLAFRIRRDYPSLEASAGDNIAADIESSLVGYFREGGLTLATVLFSSENPSGQLPSSLLRFMNEAATRYDTHLQRQAFIQVSIDIFVRSELAERDYLGRLAQGFFGFHALGTFGAVAATRFAKAKDTVWLVDSDAQIPLIADGHPSGAAFVDSFRRLRDGGVRLFTTKSLFDETWEHFSFAARTVERYGEDSLYLASAANGEVPFRKSNRFLQGFIRWRATSKKCWADYQFAISDKRQIRIQDLLNAVSAAGIEVAEFRSWPGFTQDDFALTEDIKTEIAGRSRQEIENAAAVEESLRKAAPEAEAIAIVLHERAGKYHMLVIGESDAWFVSHTGLLNKIQGSVRKTWRPEAFLSFVNTLAPPAKAADDAFEVLLWNLSESGVNVLGDDIIAAAYSQVIDDSTLDLENLTAEHGEILADKYGRDADWLDVRATSKPTVAIQLAREAAEAEKLRRQSVERVAEAQSNLLGDLRKRVKELESLVKLTGSRDGRGKQRSREIASRTPAQQKRGRRPKKSR
jgi:hypothetical protein